jgi:transposase-like protein
MLHKTTLHTTEDAVVLFSYQDYPPERKLVIVRYMVSKTEEDDTRKGKDVMEKKTYTADFKVKAVLESFQRDTTLEATCQTFGVSRSQLTRWRQEFQEKAPGMFTDKRNPAQKALSQGYELGEAPDDLKKIIGELTVQNEILKKPHG